MNPKKELSNGIPTQDPTSILNMALLSIIFRVDNIALNSTASACVYLAGSDPHPPGFGEEGELRQPNKAY